MEKPNIVVIFTDQQRFDTLNRDISPNLLEIAKEGVNFTNTFTCQPVCGPARSCLQTGKFATETGCYRNGIALPKDATSIAHHLGNEGYSTGYIGKWHLASTVLPSKDDIGEKVDYQIKPIPLERRGGYNDYWLAADLLEFTSHPFEGHLFDGDMNKVEFEGYRVDSLTDFTLEFLENKKNEQPFFLFLSYLEPHHQNDLERFVGPKNSQKRFADAEIPEDLQNLEGDWKENYADYLGCCNSIDKNVRRIYDKLNQLGMLDNTLLVFLSDHGCHFKTRNWEYKRSCHDSSIHVPLIIRGPGFSAGKNIIDLVSLIDIPPTILRAAQLPIPSYMQGRPLQDLMEDTPLDWRKEVFIQISESQVGRAIRTKRWKYSVRAPHKSGFLYTKSNTYREDFLYDLEHDPHEQHNLIHDSQYDDIKAQLENRLKRRMELASEEIPEIKPKKR